MVQMKKLLLWVGILIALIIVAATTIFKHKFRKVDKMFVPTYVPANYIEKKLDNYVVSSNSLGIGFQVAYEDKQGNKIVITTYKKEFKLDGWCSKLKEKKQAEWYVSKNLDKICVIKETKEGYIVYYTTKDGYLVKTEDIGKNINREEIEKIIASL